MRPGVSPRQAGSLPAALRPRKFDHIFSICGGLTEDSLFPDILGSIETQDRINPAMLSRVPQVRIALDSGEYSNKASENIEAYMQTLQLLERLHRRLLDLIKDEFERLGRQDLTPVQALILYNLGEDEVSAGELRSRGMYQGSNVSYNLKKLVAMGYVHHERCDLDRRSVRVRLTDEGLKIRHVMRELFIRHAQGLHQSGILSDPPLTRVNQQLRHIDAFWSERIRYIY
ncbi:DNA-binding transcriptional regulator, MarR family [Paracoccus saliphilus]|uniref:DNA-binding transcriptional regulator, MarR family n=3 Tax=Paracoccus saliphilus TaxID=405559 RepID=A0AA45W4U4_9RHOB|nr:DNA-binding transcriptional regulator, MarR family [Paracoccus saliphilus]